MATLPLSQVDLSRALVITRREIRDGLRDWRIIAPILILTLFFPALMNFTASRAVAFVTDYGAPVIGERLIPFLLMVVGFFPISVSLVIALESFVGEKERFSLEPLLATPLTNLQLYLGKTLASTVPPLLGAYLGIAVYLAGLYLNLRWTPPPELLVQILALTTIQALVMVSGAVVISTQVTSVRAANLMASFIIIPMTLLVQGESLVMFWARYDVLWVIVFGLVMINAVLVRMGVRLFNREELLGRELDELNLRAMARVYWREFAGSAGSSPDPARAVERREGAPGSAGSSLVRARAVESAPPPAGFSLVRWYRLEVGRSLRKLYWPAALMGLLAAAAFVIGYRYAALYPFPPTLFDLQHVSSGLKDRLEQSGLFSTAGLGLVVFQNVRAVLIASALGLFSFGVLAAVIFMLPTGLAGYFAGQVALAGNDPFLFLAVFILPHGILEIPAVILIGAATIHLGASLISPPPGKTVIDGWLIALADWVKIFLGLVLPLLLAAAVVEVFVTPAVVVAALGG